jgi:sn-glycerol 3-phosphate transport system substrate-binding protein
LNDAIQAALTGGKPADRALKEAQAEAERILKPYR